MLRLVLRSGFGRISTWRPDIAAAVTLYLALLFLISARLVVPGVGGFGTPANMLAMVLLATWVVASLTPESGFAGGPNPVRVVLLGFICWTLVSYAVANIESLTVIEQNGADRELLALIAGLGVAFSLIDGIRSLERLERVLKAFVVFAAVMAALGLVQFFTPIDPVPSLRPPGLVTTRDLVAGSSRQTFVRPFSTALHAIEYGVVMAMALPIALNLALHARWRRPRGAAQFVEVAVLGVAIPTTISRSAILGLVVGVGIVAAGWEWRRRVNVLAAGLAGAVVLTFTVPGLIGTIRGIFLRASNDPSIQGRIDDFAAVKEIVSEHVLFGLGVGVFNSVEDFILDNQYFGTAIALGVPGLLALLTLIATALLCCWRAQQAFDDDVHRSLARSTMAAVAVAAVSMAAFDGFSFRIFAGSLFVLVGASGALWRLAVTAPSQPARRVRRPADR